MDKGQVCSSDEECSGDGRTKNPKEKGWRHMWILDHSSCHAAIADDALDASKVNPGGKQRKIRDKFGEVWLSP